MKAVPSNPLHMNMRLRGTDNQSRSRIPFLWLSTLYRVFLAGILLAFVSTGFGQLVISPISGITNCITQVGSSKFKVWGAQGKVITWSASSDNKRLIPDGNILIHLQGTANGTNTYLVAVFPVDFWTGGTAKITLEATDEVGQKASGSFYVVIVATYCDPILQGPITIPEGAPVAANAQPYPSTTKVSGLDGYVTGVEVTLFDVSHGFPADIDILLVSPDNKATILLAHAGGSTPIAGARISIADGGEVLQATDSLENFGRYAPASFASSLDFGVPNVAASSYMTNFASLTGVGTHPNGDWSLYVQDNTYPIGGLIYGWNLTLRTSPTFAPGSVADRQTPENSTLVVPITVVSQNFFPVSFSVYASAGTSSPTNTSLADQFNLVSSLQITNNGGGQHTLIITTTPNLPSSVTNVDGTVPILLQVSDGTATNTASFILTVLFSNQPPVIAPIANQSTSVDTTITVPLDITDPDTSLDQLDISAISDDPAMLAAITAANDGTNVSATLTVAKCLSGTSIITVSARDSTNTTIATFSLTVLAPEAPVLTPIADIANTNKETTSFSVPLDISSPVTPIGALTITGISSDTNLVSAVDIVVTQSGAATANLTLVSNKTGVATITIRVSDCVTKATQSFKVIVPAPTPATLAATVEGNALKITFTGGAGTAYTIQHTTDFETWTVVATVTADEEGKGSYDVNLDSSAEAGFYRMIIK